MGEADVICSGLSLDIVEHVTMIEIPDSDVLSIMSM